MIKLQNIKTNPHFFWYTWGGEFDYEILCLRELKGASNG